MQQKWQNQHRDLLIKELKKRVLMGFYLWVLLKVGFWYVNRGHDIFSR